MRQRFHQLSHRLFGCTLSASALAMLAFAGIDGPSSAQPRIARQPDELAADLERRFAQDVAPLLETYCISCHEGDDAEGGVRLDAIKTIDDALTGHLDMRLLKEVVGDGVMPPKRKSQPTDHERLAITQWVDAVLAYVPTDAPVDPGWFTVHRLNRTEYRNTLRDLLGIDPSQVDLAARLPRDDTGYGFDNMADVLSTSPLAIEEYLAAAERAIDLSLGPVVEFGDHPRVVRSLEGRSGAKLSTGFYFYSSGGATGSFTAPLTGDYLVRIRAWEDRAGDERSKLSFRVGRETLGEFSVSGSRDNPEELELRVRIKQGEHKVSLHFLNDYYVKDSADRNVAVEWLSIAGPLDEATSDRSAAWGQIFGVASDGADDESRAAAVMRGFAARAYRRPPTDPQVASLLKVYRAVRQDGAEFEPAVRTALVAALVSPNFLFRSVAHPDAANPAARYTLDGYELASRLSYFLWSSMPDRALFDAAASGALLTDQGLSDQVRRMLADPRSNAFVENFAGQWLQLRGLQAVAIDRNRFPDYNDQVRDDMIAEATLFLGDVLRSDRSVLEFIDSRETFLNARLAKFYGVPNVEHDEFKRVTLPQDSPRGGVLTMGAVLTLTSNTTRTSPVKRGLFVLDQMLGAPPPPPPADIPPLEQAVHANANATVREQLAAHVAVASCAACHNRLDPIGLSFEHFDAIGRWRDVENGQPIDATGMLPGNIALNGSSDLKRTLLDRSDQFVESLCAKTMTYALGRGVEPFDRPAVRRIAQRTRSQQDKFSALIESVVLSETFRTCRGRKPADD